MSELQYIIFNYTIVYLIKFILLSNALKNILPKKITAQIHVTSVNLVTNSHHPSNSLRWTKEWF